MTNVDNDEIRHETDEDAITKRLNKAFESRLDLDRVCICSYNVCNRIQLELNLIFISIIAIVRPLLGHTRSPK